MKNKRGQFFIITGLIVAIIIGGLASVVNYVVTQPEPVKFYDLSEDYEADTFKIVDYGVYSGGDIGGQTIEEKLKNFTTEYLSYAQERDPNLELFYIYGDSDQVKVANYRKGSAILEHETGETTDLAGATEEVLSTISFELGEKQFSRDISERMEHFKKIDTTINDPGEWIQVRIAGALHDFNLEKDSENFYYILETTTTSGETHVIITPMEE